MESGKNNKIHALEFKCQAPLRFFERCSACPRWDDCPDLALGLGILKGKKRISYNHNEVGEGIVHPEDFRCTAPLLYFEKTRRLCGHQGRCREEGLLISLLSGKKVLDFSHKTVISFPKPKSRPGKEAARIPKEGTAVR